MTGRVSGQKPGTLFVIRIHPCATVEVIDFTQKRIKDFAATLAAVEPQLSVVV